MTASTGSKTGSSKLAAAKKKLGKKAAAAQPEEAAPIPAETPAYGLVDTATCEQTGMEYSVGDWVEYVIQDEQMTGQILRMMTQAPPYTTVAEVPNQTTGRPWTRALWELTPVQTPEADNPFPVSEAQLDEAIGGTSAPAGLHAIGDVINFKDGTKKLSGTVMNYTWDQDAAERDGYLIALPGDEDFNDDWQQVSFDRVQPPVAPPAPELTPVDVVAVPVLPLGDTLTPGTLGLHSVPLAQLVRSGCNVRRHYDPAAIEELAASLKAEGQIENATGRWNAAGQIEIVAGESRRRAQVLREEAGESGLALLVNIRELDDAEALAISATENMRRRSMTGLEECEAMMRLQDAGRTVEDLAAMFGYKSLQPVADRVLVARNLHTAGRDALDSGELSLAKAFVIARAAGEDVQKGLVSYAQHRSAAALAQLLTTGQFLVKFAGFNVEKSGLAVKRDLFDTYEAFFEDKAKALDAQLAHARTVAERRTKKGDWEFVEVEGYKGYWSPYGHKRYDGDASTGGGLVITVDLDTGELKERRNVKLRAAAKAATVSGGTPAPVEREISGPAHLAAHALRARALRHRLLGEEHTTLALTVHALMVSHGGWEGSAALSASQNWNPGAISETAVARLQAWQATLGAALGKAPALGNQPGESFYRASQSLPLYDFLVALDLPELLSLLNVIVAGRVYEPTSDPKAAPAPLYARLAAQVDAAGELAATFKLTDEWLKPYPKQELEALAVDAGIPAQPIQDAKTLKEARALILEHAERLHEQGYVPTLLRFPEPPTPVDTSERDGLRAKADPIIAALDQTGIDALSVSLGLDWTDWDSLDDCRAHLREQVLDMGVDELRGWTELWAEAAEQTAAD